MRSLFDKFNLDVLGVSASGLCLLHCLLTPVIVALFPFLGATLLDNLLYEGAFVAFSAVVGVTSLKSGYQKHHKKKAYYFLGFALLFFCAGFVEHDLLWATLFHSTGSVLLATAHIVNWKLLKAHCTICPA